MEHNYHEGSGEDNPNRILHREEEGNFLSPSIFIDEKTGKIGIEVEGRLVFFSIREWHGLAMEKNPQVLPEEDYIPVPNWDKEERNPDVISHPEEKEELEPGNKNKPWWKLW